MNWFLWAATSAVFYSLTDISCKKSLGEGVKPRFLSWYLMLSGAVVAIASYAPAFIDCGMPQVGRAFWVIVFVTASVNTVSSLAIMEAFSRVKLSILAPLAILTPMFTAMLSPIFLGERFTLIGVLGITGILAGTYFLNSTELKKGLLAPIVAFWNTPGISLVLITIPCGVAAALLDPVGVRTSSAEFYIATKFTVLTFMMIPAGIIGWRRSTFTNKALAFLFFVFISTKLKTSTYVKM